MLYCLRCSQTAHCKQVQTFSFFWSTLRTSLTLYLGNPSPKERLCTLVTGSEITHDQGSNLEVKSLLQNCTTCKSQHFMPTLRGNGLPKHKIRLLNLFLSSFLEEWVSAHPWGCRVEATPTLSIFWKKAVVPLLGYLEIGSAMWSWLWIGNIQVRKLEGSYESRENVEFHIAWTGMTVSFLAPWTLMKERATPPPSPSPPKSKILLWEEEFNVWAEDTRCLIWFPFSRAQQKWRV